LQPLERRLFHLFINPATLLSKELLIGGIKESNAVDEVRYCGIYTLEELSEEEIDLDGLK